MNAYRNTKFVNRDYECTNIVACLAESKPDQEHWEPCEHTIFVGLTRLWTERGVHYYGFM
jgi:hypothetical protein